MCYIYWKNQHINPLTSNPCCSGFTYKYLCLYLPMKHEMLGSTLPRTGFILKVIKRIRRHYSIPWRQFQYLKVHQVSSTLLKVPERERNHWKSTEPSWPAPGQGEAVRNPFLWCSSGLLLQWAKCGNLVWVLDREYSEDSVSPESLWMNSSEFTVPSHSELFLIHLYINHQPCVLPKP